MTSETRPADFQVFSRGSLAVAYGHSETQLHLHFAPSTRAEEDHALEAPVMNEELRVDLYTVYII